MAYPPREQFPPKILKSGTSLPVMNLSGKPYLQVAHRLVWLREEKPEATLQTEIVSLDSDKGTVITKATLLYSGVVISTGYKRETADNFPDYIEKSETGAVGRALAMAGFGTQYDPDLDEEERLADSPIEPAKRSKSSAPTKEQSSTGAGNSAGTAGAKPSPVQAIPNATNATAPLNGGPQPPQAKKGSVQGKAKNRADVNNLISSVARSVIAKKLYTKESLQQYMLTTYQNEAKEKLSDSQAEEFLSYLDNVNLAGSNGAGATAQA